MIRISEMVLPGHPDKFCDQVADAIVAACHAINEDAYCQRELVRSYHDIVRELALPDLEQTRRFATYVAGAHSRYKHLPFRRERPSSCSSIPTRVGTS